MVSENTSVSMEQKDNSPREEFSSGLINTADYGLSTELIICKQIHKCVCFWGGHWMLEGRQGKRKTKWMYACEKKKKESMWLDWAHLENPE